MSSITVNIHHVNWEQLSGEVVRDLLLEIQAGTEILFFVFYSMFLTGNVNQECSAIQNPKVLQEPAFLLKSLTVVDL